MDEITLKALAKINLGLDVIRRREDGYHEVSMVMQTIHLYDRLEIAKSHEPGIHIRSNLNFLPVNENNLVYKAGKLLMDEFGITDGVDVNLEKRIPVAAGMAGGSTDAASMLYGMNRIFDLGLSRRQLMERGVQIGADVLYYARYCFGPGNRRETFPASSDGQVSGTDRETIGLGFDQVRVSESEAG